MLRSLFAYVLVACVIAGSALISGAEHVAAYKLKQHIAIEELKP
jgi:hypothetical protein